MLCEPEPSRPIDTGDNKGSSNPELFYVNAFRQRQFGSWCSARCGRCWSSIQFAVGNLAGLGRTPSQRAALREIAHDPHLLSDLGLTRDEALAQANKPFWR